MFILLPLALFGTCINMFIISRVRSFGRKDAFSSLPYAIAFFSLYMFISTEIASLYKMINYTTLLIVWIIYIVTNCSFIVFNLIRYRNYCKEVLVSIKKVKILDIVPYLILFVLTVPVFIIGIYTIPYNYDAIAVYLTKVMYWAQNGQIGHFATAYLELISTPDFNNYIQLHTYILSNYSDNMLVSIQSIAYFLDILLVVLLARKMGCNKIWTILSGLVFATTPICIAEALNVQYDLVMTVYVLSFVYVATDYFNDIQSVSFNSNTIVHSVVVGILAGLAFLTKTVTAVILLVYFVGVFFFYIKNRKPIRTVVWISLVVATTAILLNLPQFTRVYTTFHEFFPDYFSSDMIIDSADPRLLIICFLKNYLFNFSGHYIYMIGPGIKKFLEGLCHILRVSINDPRISCYDNYFVNEPFDYFHDRATGEIVCLLFIVSLVIMVVNIKKRKFTLSQIIQYCIPIVSFIIFLSIMKYTNHRTRYEIAYFAILIPIIMYSLQMCMKPDIKKGFICAVLILSIIEYVNAMVYNSEIMYKQNAGGGRPFGYFVDMQYTYSLFKELTEYLSAEYKTIGLINDARPEYPLWQMVKNDIERIEAVNVYNESSVYENYEYHPDCILFMGKDEMKNIDTIECHNRYYSIVKRMDDGAGNWYVIAEESK